MNERDIGKRVLLKCPDGKFYSGVAIQFEDTEVLTHFHLYSFSTLSGTVVLHACGFEKIILEKGIVEGTVLATNMKSIKLIDDETDTFFYPDINTLIRSTNV